jgi:catechol 2,3-dioxygenase-like lactoylglutathione lyase family enzyme
VLAAIDLAKEIDSVENRELRVSRAIVAPGGHIGLHSHQGDPTIVSSSTGFSPTTATTGLRRNFGRVRYLLNLARDRIGLKTTDQRRSSLSLQTFIGGNSGSDGSRSTEVREAMMFKRIDHVEIVTDQLDRTVQFYTEILGFNVKARDRIERSGLGVPIDLVYLDLGGTVVELISYEGAAVDPAPQTEHLGYRMIALEVDDMHETADYLRTKGVDMVWGPRVRETYSRAEICDPNGFHIELRQWFR